MATLTNELTKIAEQKAYIELKHLENSIMDDYLEDKIGSDLVDEIMDECDFELERLISLGHLRADLIRAAGL